MTRKYVTNPNRHIPSSNTGDIQQILKDIIYEFFNPKNVSKYDVLVHRFGLNGKKPLTLEEIGVLRGGLSRERIRQLEKTGLTQLKTLLETGLSQRTLLDAYVLEQIRAFRSSLDSFAPATTESIIIAHTKNFFAVNAFDKAFLELLLSIFGFHSLKLSDGTMAWVFTSIDTNRIEEIVSKISKYLREHSESRSWQEILLSISKQSRNAKYKPDEIQIALSLAPDVENLGDGNFQLVFNQLDAVGDRIYRLLYQRIDQSPMEVEEITKLHNQEVKKYGLNPNAIGTIGGALSKDSRFQNIGRSGRWVLTKWGYSPENLLSVPDLIERALKHTGNPLTPKEIYDFVSELRDVDYKHVRADLTNNPKRFVRQINGRFGLRTLSKSSDVAIRVKKNKTGITSTKVAFMIAQVFQQQVHQMKLADLQKELQKLMPEYSYRSIWGTLTKRNPAITITGLRGSQIAIFKPEFKEKIPAIDLASNGERGVFIRRTIQDVLIQYGKISLKELREKVAILCHITPRNVFSYVKKMGDIIQVTDLKSDKYCELKVDIAAEYADGFTSIKDMGIRDEIARGLSNLNLDNVDLGLFLLGRAFDVMSKRYCMILAKKGSISTSSGIATEAEVSRWQLAKRIDLLVSNGFLKDKNALTILREERNDPAHNIQSIENRREMLITASTYAKWYIEYISLFESAINVII